jgi:hypothetical protein
MLAGKAFIAETPIDKPGDDRRNVATLWKLVGKTVVASGRDGMKPRKKSAGSRGSKGNRRKAVAAKRLRARKRSKP